MAVQRPRTGFIVAFNAIVERERWQLMGEAFSHLSSSWKSLNLVRHHVFESISPFSLFLSLSPFSLASLDSQSGSLNCLREKIRSRTIAFSAGGCIGCVRSSGSCRNGPSARNSRIASDVAHVYVRMCTRTRTYVYKRLRSESLKRNDCSGRAEGAS